MTLDDVGLLVGVGKQTIFKYEAGIISNIPHDKIELLARALSVTPAQLMGWDAMPLEVEPLNSLARRAEAHMMEEDQLRNEILREIKKPPAEAGEIVGVGQTVTAIGRDGKRTTFHLSDEDYAVTLMMLERLKDKRVDL
jgi:transcriptional regulator with XRE-family HTH domain